MITKRIIPCLDVKDGRVVKGVNFEGLHDVSSPVSLAKFYSENGADELVFYDITASSDGRKLYTDILCETAKSVLIPLTVGGGIISVEDFDRVLKCGADKVSVNSGAIRNPRLVYEAAKLYGELSKTCGMQIIASGGVSSMEDIRALAAMDLYGAIIGKAYYTGAIDLKEAIEVAR